MNDDVSDLCGRVSGGDREARDALFTVLYDELKRRAAALLRQERRGHTLSPTALVNEAYMRLAPQRRVGEDERVHFLAIAAMAMRRVLLDHARARHRVKRPGRARRVDLDSSIDLESGTGLPPAELMALDNALTELARLDERQARVVELRYFGALTVPEAARVLGVAVSTVEADWRLARAWLRRELSGGETP